MTTPYSAAAVIEATFVRCVEVLAEVGSTNDFARQQVESLAPEDLPTLVVADKQTAGRGRGANRWWSTDGALTFSLVFDPSAFGLSNRSVGALSITTALALCDALAETARVEAGIKWPNDVLLDGKKVAGVLLEAPKPDRLVIGVGVNVANSMVGAPAEVRDLAVSLVDACATSPSRQDVLLAFLRHFAQRIGQLAVGDTSIAEAWNHRSTLNGTSTALRVGDQEIVGECVGIAEDGSLKLRRDGAVACYHTGTIVR